MIFCVNKAMHIYFIDGKCHTKKLKSITGVFHLSCH